MRVQVGDEVVDSHGARPPRRRTTKACRLTPDRPTRRDGRDTRQRSSRDRREQMAELTIRPDEIRAALDSFVESYEPTGAVREEVGHVTLAGDGIAQVEGLPGRDGQRAAAVRGRHARPRAQPRRARDRRRRAR